jgi:RNA polymerase sigma factor (sigma-70 family)
MQKKLNWNIIYKENSPKLLGICRRYVSDLATAEDIVQDSFLKAIENQHQLKIENAMFSWLKQIVVNNTLQHLKNNKNFYFNDFSSNDLENIENIEETDFLSQQFSTEEMLASIDQLPSHHKAVFNLYFLENYSHAEIAKQLDININTSKSHLLRAKKTIKQQLMKTKQSSNSLKKRGIQLLVFLGFGNLLWAKSFQKNFNDFTIAPQKKFQPEISNQNFTETKLNSNTSTKKSYNKWVIVLLLIFSLVFYIWNSNVLFENENLNIKENASEKVEQNSIENEDKKPELAKENFTKQVSEKKDKTEIEEVQKPLNKAKEVSFVKSEKTEIPENQENDLSKIDNKINTSIVAISLKDSSKISKRKKVIVVKKTIKRDTVYIKK